MLQFDEIHKLVATWPRVTVTLNLQQVWRSLHSRGIYLRVFCRRFCTGLWGRAFLFGLGERVGRPRLGGLRERVGEEGALLQGLGVGLRRRFGGLRDGGGLERRFGGSSRERGFLGGVGERDRGCSFSGLVEGLVEGLGGCSRGEGERGLRDFSFCGGEGLGRLFFFDSIFFLECGKSEGVRGPFLLRDFLSGLGEPSEDAL